MKRGWWAPVVVVVVLVGLLVFVGILYFTQWERG